MDKVRVLICLALMLMSNTADRRYFFQNSKLTWNEARTHCQQCFTDLVALNHDNIEMIVKNLSSLHWIGLRKNYSSTSHSTSDIKMSWSYWSNGDPLTFQNWYPGWPLSKPSAPDIDCCGCSCTSPPSAAPTMSITDNMTMTSSAFPDTTFMTTAVSKTADGYIEDSCVAMYSFGPWVEKNCGDRLPFICQEDLSSGYFKAYVTSVTSESVTVTWLQVPGGIQRYHVVVKGDKELTVSTTNLTHNLFNLTAGTRYVVHVFPVKCERKMTPENITFYTKPNKVKNFTATRVTETSIQVNWSKPAGNLDLYLLRVGSQQFEITTEGKEVEDLMPGRNYTLTVRSEVKDRSMWSEESTITVYTKPSKVSNLNVSDNTNHSVLLRWELPKGDVTGFLVKAMNSTDDVLFENEVGRTDRTAEVTSLPTGTKITLAVIALASSLQGDDSTISTYTAPGPISNLTVVTSHNSLDATWAIAEGGYSYFIARLLLDEDLEQPERNLTEAKVTFYNLKTAAEYTVVVYAVSGHIKGRSMAASCFTLPSPPTNAFATYVGKRTITFNWSPPENIAKAKYFVKLSTSFYGRSWSDRISNKTSYTFSDLISGTKYCFEVSVLGGELKSAPERNCSVITEPDERQVSLSMLCSSATSLLCGESATRTRVFEQLHEHFKKLLKDDIIWDLEAIEA